MENKVPDGIEDFLSHHYRNLNEASRNDSGGSPSTVVFKSRFENCNNRNCSRTYISR